MAETFKGARLFLNIPAKVAHDPRFKSDKSILLLGEIYSMLNITGSFYMSNKELAKRMRCKKNTVINCVHELEQLGYIKTKIMVDPVSGATRGRSISLTTGVNLNEPPRLNGMDEGGSIDCTQIEHIKRTSKRTKNIYSQAGPDKTSSLRKEIIGYLNEKLGTKYKPNASKNKTVINARLKEGYSFDDFKTVVDNKIADWGNSPKMSKFLRPETLFGPKFDGYLSEKRINQKPNTHQGKDWFAGFNRE